MPGALRPRRTNLLWAYSVTVDIFRRAGPSLSVSQLMVLKYAAEDDVVMIRV